ncbi:MAG TPA: hypothetical protein PLV55_06120 [Anaerohalosphaeraceae bacterium]|mgnify:CR=1 FL=1|nr:hypothetical protein [Anaerohalosphaeraceae bacterium]
MHKEKELLQAEPFPLYLYAKFPEEMLKKRKLTSFQLQTLHKLFLKNAQTVEYFTARKREYCLWRFCGKYFLLESERYPSEPKLAYKAFLEDYFYAPAFRRIKDARNAAEHGCVFML